jgi:ATP synthase F1 gamma subunit
MIRKQAIAAETTQLDILHTVTSAYGQIASMWLNRTRDSVLRSRDFLEEINQVFLTVFSAYAETVQKIAHQHKQTRNGKITFLSHNGKKVAVFLSANTGFYGEIVNRTFELFLREVRENNYEATIVGKQGLALFVNEEPNRPKTYFDFSDEKVNQHDLLDLVRHLAQYEEIRIYYGKFKNFLMQEPVIFRLSANPYDNLDNKETLEKQPKSTQKYIFEPDMENILMFFEKQIFTSVFEQTVRESQLAKFASRIMVMDRASENIKERLKKMELQKLKIFHSVANRKQQNQFASMKMWT